MKILLHAPNQTAASGMAYLAELAQHTSDDVVLLLEEKFDVKADVVLIVLEEKTKSFFSLFRRLLIRCIPENSTKIIKICVNKIRTLKATASNREEIWKANYLKKKNKIRSIIESFSPDSVYLYGDRHDGHELAIIQISREKKIPIIVIPIAYAAGIEDLLWYRKRTDEILEAHDVTDIMNFKKTYPSQWVYDESTGRDISYYPYWTVSARQAIDVLPENPWSIGGGRSDLVCVSGERERSRFLRNGVSYNKIRVTGGLEDDRIHSNFVLREKLRSRLTAKYFTVDNKILLVALPQLFEHEITTESEHWNLQLEICEAVTTLGWNVLVSLHPKMDKRKYAKMLKKYDFKILDEPLRDVISVADIFLVGQGSSTANWAVLCEVPLVIMDWYGLNYKMHDWINGKIVVKSIHNFQKELLELSKNEQLRQIMSAQHRKQKYLVSPFDGKCVTRILNMTKVNEEGSSENEHVNSGNRFGP